MFPLKPLEEVAKIIRGITFKPDDVISPEDENAIVCFRTKNVQQRLDESDLIAVPPEFVKREDQNIRNGDILVSSANSWNLVGKCCYVPELNYSATAGGFISILRGDSEKIDSRYLYHWFSSPDIQTLLRSFGRKTTNISNLNINLTLQAKIPLPPLPEQKRIAEVLDKADALREKRRLALQKLDTLLQSVFLEMFGDPVKNPKGLPKTKISEISTRITKGESPNWQGFGYEETGIRFVTSENVGWGRIIVKNDKFISNEFNHKIRRSQVVENDLLINLVGASIGRAAIATSEILPANVNQAVAVVTLDRKKVFPGFVLEQILSESVQRVLTGKIVEAARANISLKNVGDLEVLFPPSEMQEKYYKIKVKISESVQKQIKDSINLEHLFQSLQQRAFKGELFRDESLTVKPQEETAWQQTSLS